MIVLSGRYLKFFQMIICLACFCSTTLSSQTIDKRYLGRWSNYTQGSPAKPDSNYTIVDTIIEMTFLLNETYNITGYVKTDIFTPGKGHLKFKKKFRYADGRYEIKNDQLELITVISTEQTICRLYVFESATNKFKQVNLYDRLWDTRNFYEYAPVADFRHSDMFFSRKRKQQMLYTISPTGNITDSLAFWNTNPECASERQWPKPIVLPSNLPLKTDTLGGFDDMVDDPDNIYLFDNTNRLSRYYYTSKKDESFYYDLTYADSLIQENTTIKMIADSKDASSYVFIRDEKNCLIKIEHYNKENRILETYYAK